MSEYKDLIVDRTQVKIINQRPKDFGEYLT